MTRFPYPTVGNARFVYLARPEAATSLGLSFDPLDFHKLRGV